MSQIELVFGYSRKIEGILQNAFNAQGRGLHSKLTHVEDRLPMPLVKKIRWIATIRNNLAHSDGFQIDDIADFTNACESVLSELVSIAENLPLAAADEKRQVVYVTNKFLLAATFAAGLVFGMVLMRQVDFPNSNVFRDLSSMFENQDAQANTGTTADKDLKAINPKTIKRKGQAQREEH